MANTIPLITSLMLAIAVLLAFYSWQSVWDWIAGRYVVDLTETITALDIDRSKLPMYLRLWGFAILGSFLLFTFVLQMLPIALAVSYFIYISPRLFLHWEIVTRKSLLRDQLVGATVALANTTRAGLSLAQGFESVGRETPTPLQNELQRIVTEFQRGLPLSDAIRNTKERLRIDSFTLFSAAILTNLERGGRVTEALERISTSLQENQRLERKMEAETASGKRVVVILSLFPFLFLLLYLLIYPSGTMQVLTSWTGQLILVVVFVLVYVSARWSYRILSINER